jgi:hypothetical protein
MTLAIPAGETLNVAFEIENDNPLDVAGFYFTVTDLPAEWWGGPNSADPRQVVAGGRDILTLSLRPAAGAQPANYPFSVQIQAVNDLAGVPPACALTLSVEPGAAPTPVPEVEPESFEQEVREQEIVAPEMVEPEVVADAPEVIEPAPPVVEAAPPPEPEPAPVVEPPPSSLTPPTPPAPMTVEPAAPPAPKPVRPVAKAEAPVSRPAPKQSAPPPKQAAPRQPAPKPVEPAPVETVSLQREPIAVEVQQKVTPLPEADRQVINPEDRRILRMLPGERMLLRFKFHNTQNYPCNYILDEDRMAALPDGWLDRTQAQVNLTPNAEGEVFCLIIPPANARPGEYQFAVFIGTQHAERPEERYYTLLIEATPAVKLAAKEQKKQAGPFSYQATFPLTVANAGNSETAFRVAVRESKVVTDDDEEAQIPRDIYESPAWTYQFDREVDNLKAPAQGRDLKPVEVSLHIKRRGPWWWGFQESHTATVAAVPVTDYANGGKEENLTQVTFRRWRLLPFPYIFLVPIILALLIIGSRAWNLRVTNGLESRLTNTYFVFGSTARIAWNAFPLMPQTLSFGEEKKLSFTHSYPKTVDLGNSYVKTTGCSVKNSNLSVNFLASKTDDKLKVVADYTRVLQHAGDETTVSEDKVEMTQAVYTIEVRRENFPIQFMNSDPKSVGSQIKIYPVELPDAANFRIVDLSNPETGYSPASGGDPTPPFKVTALQPNVSGDFVFVTTDRAQPIVRLRLESQ